MIEKTLIVIKPDGVKRGLIGEVIKRFEQRGFKIVAMKMVFVDVTFAMKHYDEDLAKRRGEKVRKYNVDFLTEGPVVAMIIQGVNAIENVRKIVGSTEPKSALPGTIRGDFSHVSYEHCDSKSCVVRNVIHASDSKESAKKEIDLWFKESEINDYKLSHESEVM